MASRSSIPGSGRDRVPSDVATEHETFVSALDGASPSDRVFLVVRRGDQVDVVDVADGASVTFGRSEDVQVRIDETRVSRRHALIRRAGTSLVLEDLDSRNGTWLNSQKLEGSAEAVSGGDVIRVGSAEIVIAVVESGTGPGSAPTEPTHQKPSWDLGGIVVADPAMVEVFRVARRLAAMPTTVLLLGETGVGKEVVAERIHRWSNRSRGPFVRLNCAALAPTLLESELFGHERGAFTGADQRKTGYFEGADRGTLFMDEVGELPPDIQVKLLTVLESRRLRRLGGSQEFAVDVRVIAATNRDLEKDVAARRFREDLFYRLSAFKLEIPPLRERKVEVLLLAELFARDIARVAGMPPPVIDPQASAALGSYSWPGNVRELRNAVEHAVVLAERGHILLEHLPRAVRGDGEPPPRIIADLAQAPRQGSSGAPLDSKLAEVERHSIVDALAATSGNQTRAAQRLGITRSALIHRMKKHGLG